MKCELTSVIMCVGCLESAANCGDWRQIFLITSVNIFTITIVNSFTATSLDWSRGTIYSNHCILKY